MFDIEPYEHKNIKTSAYFIRVEDTDPLFAANLANEIVKKYFEFQKLKSRENFKKAVKYLSDTLADASIDLKKSQEKLEAYLLQNAEVLVESGNLGNSDPLLSARSLRSLKQLAVLGETEKFERGLLNIQNELEALLDEDIRAIKKFVQKVGVSGGLSRQFVGKVTVLKTTKIWK